MEATIVLASIRTPRDVADWLATGPTQDEKIAMHDAAVTALGPRPTIALWSAGHEIHHRRRSTCQAAREAWAVATMPDVDGQVRCPVCGDRVDWTTDPVCRDLVVIAAHRFQEAS